MAENNPADNIQQIQQRLQELQQKYLNLEQEIKKMEKNKLDVENINQNIQQIMEKLNMLGEQRTNTMAGAVKRETQKMMANPVRTFTVGTIRLLLAVADKSREGIENLREELEDIVAEAQYENKKRRMQSVQQNS